MPRALVVAASACLWGQVFAVGLNARLSNGQTLSVVESPTSSAEGFSFERRNPDGTRDRQFGTRGRVPVEPGTSGSVPTTIRADASDHIFMAGTGPIADRSSGATVSRFLSTGRIDVRWGDQGLARLPVASGDGLATDLMPLPDGSVVVVGRVEDKGAQRASIWRIDPSGHAELSFGQQGALLATALPLSQVLSIQQGTQTSLQLAVQTSEGGRSWLEMHRWQSGDAVPSRVARQELPDQWVGPASLVLKNGQWFWLDPSQPDSPVAAVLLDRPDSPWGQAELPRVESLSSADAEGHAAMNPYGRGSIGMQSEPAETFDAIRWFVGCGAAVLVAGALIWRSIRS